MVLRSRGQPRHGPRFGRARWSITTLRSTAAARAVIAGALLLIGLVVAAPVVLVLTAPGGKSLPSRLGAVLRPGALALVVLVAGLYQARRAWSLWREARQRPPTE